MPIQMNVVTQLDGNSADKAASMAKEKFVDAAKDISQTFGTVIEKAFDRFDTTKVRKELSSLQDEYAKTGRAAEDSATVAGRAARDVEVAVKRVHEAHEKYGASASQSAAAENRLVDAWARSSRAALDSAAAADVAAEAHSHLQQATTAAGGAAEGLNSSMLLAVGGVAAVGAAVLEAGHELFDMGEQWADLSDKISFTTGKIGEDADKMSDSIAHIADHADIPVSKIGDVYTQLTRLKDLQGPVLDRLTHQVSEFDRMAQNAGSDPLNLGSFTRTMQEFHVPADQMGKDLDIINSAAQDGQVPLNELLKTMQESGPTADLAGLSFGQMANVLAAIDESGVNADTALKGFRMALGNIAADAPKLQKLIKFAPDENELQRLKDVVQKIQDLHQAGDDVGAIDLGKTVFGRSWSDIGQAILDDKLNVDTLNTSIDGTGKSIEDQAAATKHFGDEWQEVKNKVTDALKPLATDVFTQLDDGLKELGDWVTAHGTGVNEFFTDLANGIAVVNPLTWIAQAFPDPTPPSADPGASGAGHDADSQRAHRGVADDNNAGKPNVPSGSTGTPTAPDINTAAPYYPLDLNPADKPAGAETYDEWVSSQKAVQAALNRQADTAEQLSSAQARQRELLDSGKATQDELNANAAELAKAQRDNLQSTQDLTIAQQKYVEDANKTKKGKDPWDDQDPFKDATKNVHGLVPELAALFSAAALNQALGNPYGKMQAAKRGEDPSNPLYVADVSGSGGGVTGFLDRQFRRDAIGQAPLADAGQQELAPSNAPAGSIPQLVPSGAAPTAQTAGSAAAGGPDWDKIAGAESSGNWAINTGNGFYGGLQFTQSSWDATKPPGAPARADLATPDQQKQAAAKLFATQGPGAWPATSAAHPDWFKSSAPVAQQAANVSAAPGAPTSQNGWPDINASQAVPDGFGSQLAPGASTTLLSDFAKWFNTNIEPVTSTAGYRSGTPFDHQIKSNHISGTALDLNPDDFPGFSGGRSSGAGADTHFSPQQIAAIQAKLATYGGAIKWGNDWTGSSKDPMHYELGDASDSVFQSPQMTYSGRGVGFRGGPKLSPASFGDPGNPGLFGPGMDRGPGTGPSGGSGLFGPAIGYGSTPNDAPGGLFGAGITPGAVTGYQGTATPNDALATPHQQEGTGSGIGIGGGAGGAAASAATGALNMLAPGAGIAAQIGLQEATRAVQFGGQALGIGAEGLFQTFLPDLPMNGPLAKALGGLAGGHPVNDNKADSAQQNQNGYQSKGSDGQQVGASAPPLSANGPGGNTDNSQQSGDTVHGNQINGDVTINQPAPSDPTAGLGMQQNMAGMLP